MVITDLDGTLLNDNRQISDKDIKTLRLLKKHNILRVIATGRNLFSAQKVLQPDSPIDYLIFSSGAGILKWENQKLIYKSFIPADIVTELTVLFSEALYDFMVHQPPPDNHHFFYRKSGKNNKDFERRLSIYRPFGKRLNTADISMGPACQLLIITDEADIVLPKLKNELSHLNVIRTTSPLDGKTTWIEIFPKQVSKDQAAQWLLDHLDHKPQFTVAVGNDYNDHDLLQWADHSFVVANAVQELKNQFNNSLSNSESGFSDSVRKVLDFN